MEDLIRRQGDATPFFQIPTFPRQYHGRIISADDKLDKSEMTLEWTSVAQYCESKDSKPMTISRFIHLLLHAKRKFQVDRDPRMFVPFAKAIHVLHARFTRHERAS